MSHAVADCRADIDNILRDEHRVANSPCRHSEQAQHQNSHTSGMSICFGMWSLVAMAPRAGTNPLPNGVSERVMIMVFLPMSAAATKQFPLVGGAHVTLSLATNDALANQTMIAEL